MSKHKRRESKEAPAGASFPVSREERKLLKKKSYRELSDEQRELYRARKKYETRERALRKRGQYSYAAERMKNFYKEVGGRKKVSELSQGSIQVELNRLKEFFGSKGASVGGAKRINSQLEGRLGMKLSDNQVKDFWTLYDQIMKNRFLATYAEGIFPVSEEVQRILGSMMFGAKTNRKWWFGLSDMDSRGVAERVISRLTPALGPIYERYMGTASNPFEDAPEGLSEYFSRIKNEYFERRNRKYTGGTLNWNGFM